MSKEMKRQNEPEIKPEIKVQPSLSRKINPIKKFTIFFRTTTTSYVL